MGFILGCSCPVDHDPSLHGRPSGASVPHDGEGHDVRHDQGHGHPWPELHPEQRVPGGTTHGTRPGKGHGRDHHAADKQGEAEIDQVKRNYFSLRHFNQAECHFKILKLD